MKEVIFIEKLNIGESEKESIKEFLISIFRDDAKIFKEMVAQKKVRIKGKSFTFIDDETNNKTYKIMGNCIGPVLYVYDVIDKK